MRKRITPTSTDVKLNPFLALKPMKDGTFVLDSFYNKKSLLLTSELADSLGFFMKWRKLEELGEYVDAADELLKLKIILNRLDPIWDRHKKGEVWRGYGYEKALYYHLNGFEYPFLNYREPEVKTIDQHLMSLYRKQKSPPSIYKSYEQNEIILLSPPNLDVFKESATDIICAIKRSVESKSFDVKNNFSTFLYSSFGKTKENPPPDIRFFRTSPSGGGKHPTEAYILVFKDGVGIKPGVYHYNIKDHALDVLSKDNAEGLFDLATGRSLVMDGPSFAVAYSSMVERAMWRYHDIRSTRAVFADVGHIAQTTRYNASVIGFSTVGEYNFDEQKLAEICKIDLAIEPIFLVSAFYKKDVL